MRGFLNSSPTFIGLQTLLNKEIFRFMRIWTQTLLPPAITTALYFLIFGRVIGSRVGQIEGYSYIQYIAPGLVMMSVMMNAYANTSSSFFFTKFNKSIEELLVSPMPNWAILTGFMLGGMVRGILVGAIVMLVALLFTHLPLHHPVMILCMAVLSAMVFSLGGFINAIFAKRFDDISFIPTFILTPLTYLGGVFYSIKQLPPFWRAISVFNPLLCIVDTFRYATIGFSEVGIGWGLMVVVALFFILFFWAWALLNKGVGIKI